MHNLKRIKHLFWNTTVSWKIAINRPNTLSFQYIVSLPKITCWQYLSRSLNFIAFKRGYYPYPCVVTYVNRKNCYIIRGQMYVRTTNRVMTCLTWHLLHNVLQEFAVFVSILIPWKWQEASRLFPLMTFPYRWIWLPILIWFNLLFNLPYPYKIDAI